MLEFLSNYTGTIYINDEQVSAKDFSQKLENSADEITITLLPKNYIDCNKNNYETETEEIVFYVKPWMTEKSNPEFQFMAIWNNDTPMPLRYMGGTIEKETSRMYYVSLHGIDKPPIFCARCGRTLLNPISKEIGVGPECASKLGINPEIFLMQTVDSNKIKQIKGGLRNITWEGWLPKTAILETIKIPN